MPASIAEEEIPEEDIPVTLDIDTDDVEAYTIDELKQAKNELSQEYVQLEAQRWIDFVLNLIAYINDFESITVKTVHDGEYQIDATTNFGLINISDENDPPVYEATSVNTIFITTETVTTPVEENDTTEEDPLIPPTEPEEEDVNTDNVPDDTEIEE